MLGSYFEEDGRIRIRIKPGLGDCGTGFLDLEANRHSQRLQLNYGIAIHKIRLSVAYEIPVHLYE